MTVTNILKISTKISFLLIPISHSLKILFFFHHKVYDGYMDDERNTDNAWLETSVKHFHDDGNALRRFFLNVRPYIFYCFFFADKEKIRILTKTFLVTFN